MEEPQETTDRPPLGSWVRMYGLVAALAVLLMVLLYWFTSTFNVPLPS